MKQSYTLHELNEYIRRVIALNFDEPIWINCEIAQVNEVRGNYYLELVEQDEKDTIKAQLSAAIWYKNFLFIRNKLGELTNSILSAGTHIQVKVKIDFHERYGMKLIIEDIDPSYTMGRLEMARQKIIERLNAEKVTTLNKEIPLPSVIQRVAIISSATAAGYKDFVAQCNDNPYGYKYDFTLYQSAMQGQNTEREVCDALDKIAAKANQFDAAVIIRGGGSKLDLSFFDNFNIGYKIATSKVPIIVGIGHEIDSSVADLVAAISLKTPTAVADYLIDKSAHYETSVVELTQRINHEARQQLNLSELRFTSLMQNITLVPKGILIQTANIVETIFNQIEQSSKTIIRRHLDLHEGYIRSIKAYDPKTIMKKGFAFIKQDSQYISTKKDLIDKEFTITFSDGTVKAKIK